MAINVENFLRSPVADRCEIVQLRSPVFDKSRFRGALRMAVNLVNACILTLRYTWLLLTRRPSLVHIRTNSYAGFYEKGLLCLLGRLFRRPTILQIHGGAFQGFYQNSWPCSKCLIRFLLLTASRLIVLSAAIREFLCTIGVPYDKISVLANAVFVPGVSALDGLPARRGASDACASSPLPRLLFLNRVTVEKGILDLLKAVALLRETHPTVLCDICGPVSPPGPWIREAIEELSLEGCCQLHGEVRSQAKEVAYLRDNVYVLPSYIEGVPMGLLEAMSYGLPVVATRVGGIPEVISDGENGFLVPPGEPQELARAVGALFADTALRHRVGRSARELVERDFSWTVSADRVISVYNELARPRLARPVDS